MTERRGLRLAPDQAPVDAEGIPWPEAPMDTQPPRRNGNSHHRGGAEPRVRPFAGVDLAALARAGLPEPELLCHGLLYRGGLHSLAGPPDAGKSTIAYLWALELLAQGERVVLLDEESGREQVTEKLLALGALPEHLDPTRLFYQDFPARRWDATDQQALAELLDQVRPALLVVDSAGAFLAIAGLSENESEHVTSFYKGVLLAAARGWNTAVVVLDHQGKADEQGRYARGSGAKLALVDVHLRVEAKVAFSRASSGLLKLTVQKDRRGWLHRTHEVAVNVDPAEGALALVFTPVDHAPTATPAGQRPQEFPDDPATGEPALAELAPAARKLLVVLREAQGQPLRRGELVDRVKARWNHGLQRQTVSSALNELAKRGLADGEQGDDHGQKRWWAP
jgi:hypothetical protein